MTEEEKKKKEQKIKEMQEVNVLIFKKLFFEILIEYRMPYYIAMEFLLRNMHFP